MPCFHERGLLRLPVATVGNLTAVIRPAVYTEFNNHGTQQSLCEKLSILPKSAANVRPKSAANVRLLMQFRLYIPRKSYGEELNEHVGHGKETSFGLKLSCVVAL